MTSVFTFGLPFRHIRPFFGTFGMFGRPFLPPHMPFGLSHQPAGTATSMVATPYQGACSLSVDLTFYGISAAGGRKRFAPDNCTASDSGFAFTNLSQDHA